MSFLTVEDVNSSLIKYGSVNIFHEIDTSYIGIDEFSNVKYDFCVISHTINGNKHQFEFNIVNKNWVGAYYFTKSDGEYLDFDADFQTNSNSIILVTEEPSVKLILYCTNLTKEFNFVRMTWRPVSLNPIITSSINANSLEIPVLSLNNEDLSNKQYTLNYHLKSRNLSSSWYHNFKLNDKGQVIIRQNGSPNSDNYSFTFNGVTFYYDVFIKKVQPEIKINEDLVVGKLNQVKLSVPKVFSKPNGYVVSSAYPLLNGYIYFEDKIIPLEFNGEDYYFDLDLKEKMDNKKVKFRLKILENDYIQENNYDFIISSKYVSIDNISDFIKELGVDGSKIIELSNDFNFVDDILVTHDIIIYGDNHSLNLNEHSFILKEGTTLKIKNLSFNKGDTTIIQKENSTLELTDCKFHNCKSSNYNNIGSCIFCDVDLESLNVEDDFTTIISNCLFINNHSSILHGGQLTVDNCKFLNNDVKMVEMNNPAFLYQVDGDATISNSIFDIDFGTNEELCNNEINIGFSQALIMCGETATINKANHSNLQYDESLPFFEAPYSNKSHLFVKYYYPSIESCVFSSPMTNFEDSSCCHAVSGVDWVFKNNVLITKESWKTENITRKIEWGDI